MADDPPKGPRAVRTVATVVVGALVPLAIVAVLYLLAGSHRVLPGMRGCMLIRDPSAQTTCVAHEFRARVHGSTASASDLARVDRLAAKWKVGDGECHLAWHQAANGMGRALRRAHHLPSLNVPVRSLCQQGYVHGIVIGYFQGHAATAADMRTLCGHMTSGGELRNCSHTFGHVFSATSASTADAVASCAAVGHDVDADRYRFSDESGWTHANIKNDCYRGIFMQYALVQHASAPSFRNSCASIGKQVRPLCLEELPLALQQSGRSIVQIGAACQKTPLGQQRDYCVIGVGQVAQRRGDCGRSLRSTADIEFCQTIWDEGRAFAGGGPTVSAQPTDDASR